VDGSRRGKVSDDTFDELDEYLDGDWSHQSVEKAIVELDKILNDGIRESKMPEVERPKDWNALMDFVKEHKLDQEEYFTLDYKTDPTEPIWNENIRWISVYWVEGGSEGYYLHVDQMNSRGVEEYFRSRIMALGKYWSKAEAERACGLITRWCYGLRLTDVVPTRGVITPDSAAHLFG
jgi:hypothetical protein